MKKIYELPEVTVFEVGPVNSMLVDTSNFGMGSGGEKNGLGYDELTNSNSFDDQATPWYRR